MTDIPDTEATALRDCLADRDARCPRCGYGLRGLKAASCPECGCEPVLSLEDPAVPRLLWWFALVCATVIAVGEGIAGVSSLGLGFAYWGDPRSTGTWVPWIVASGQCSVAAVASFFVVRLLTGRRRCGRRALRIMLIIAVLYGIGWVLDAIYWTGEARGWWWL